MRRLALLALLAEATPKPLPLVPRGGGGRPRDANAAFFGDLDGVGALCEREATPGINLGEAVGRLVRLVTALRSLALVAAAAAGHSAGRANARKDARAEAAYADSVAEARNDLAAAAPEPIAVHWTETSLEQVRREAIRLEEPLQALIEQCLAQDPRPAYQTPAPDRRYGTRLWDVDVRWHYPDPASITVVEVSRAER